MPQSSLMTWLGKPAAVTQAPKAPLAQDKKHEPKAQEKDSAPLPTTNNDQSQPPAPKETPNTKPFPKPTKPALHPNVHLRAPTKADIPSFKHLNSLLLPIPYPDSFYREILTEPLDRNITLLALWHDDPSTISKTKGRLIGAIRCRLLNTPPPTPAGTNTGIRREGPMLYLSTLVLLSPYRGHGIAAHMLDVLTKRAVEDYGVSSVGAHVWEANEEGLAWYRKHGFREVSREGGYYRKLNPQGAVVVRREVGVMDLAG